MISLLRNSTRGTNDCSFRIRRTCVLGEPSFFLECRPPFSPVFQSVRSVFGFDLFTRPKARFSDYEDAEFVRNFIIETGYSWYPEKQCYLLHVYKKEPESWKSPSSPLQTMPISSAGAMAFSTQ